MATHSSVLAWRIPGMGEPGGLLSMGSQRVGHDWSNLAAAVNLGVEVLSQRSLSILLRMRHVKGLSPHKSRAPKQRGLRYTLKEVSDTEPADWGLRVNLLLKPPCSRSRVVLHWLGSAAYQGHLMSDFSQWFTHLPMWALTGCLLRSCLWYYTDWHPHISMLIDFTWVKLVGSCYIAQRAWLSALERAVGSGGVGGRLKRQGMYVYLWQTFWCTAEANTTL